MLVGLGSVSSSNLHCGLVHVVSFGSLSVGSVISNLSIGNVGVLSWVVILVFIILISRSWVSLTCCILACKAATMKDLHPLLKSLTLVKGHVTLARLTKKTHWKVGK